MSRNPIWFKHYCDAQSGRSLQELMARFGHRGPNSYWILVGLCTEKFWEYAALHTDTELSDIPCVFRFHRRTLINEMYTRPNHLEQWLEACAELGLFSYSYSNSLTTSGVLPSNSGLLQSSNEIEAAVSKTRSQFEISIAMPKLLEILDRDRKVARKKRVKTASQSSEYSENREQSPPNPQSAESGTEQPEQKPEAEAEPNASGDDVDKNQLALPGVLKPSEEKSAVDLMLELIHANNTALSKSQEVSKLICFRDALSKQKNKSGWRKEKK